MRSPVRNRVSSGARQLAVAAAVASAAAVAAATGLEAATPAAPAAVLAGVELGAPALVVEPAVSAVLPAAPDCAGVLGVDGAADWPLAAGEAGPCAGATAQTGGMTNRSMLIACRTEPPSVNQTTTASSIQITAEGKNRRGSGKNDRNTGVSGKGRVPFNECGARKPSDCRPGYT